MFWFFFYLSQAAPLPTTHGTISHIDNIEKAKDINLFVCGIFIDLQKAFVTVDHNILLHKLSHYGIRDLANSLFYIYLSNRKQSVTINSFNSETQNLRYGVPQGSLLSPPPSVFDIPQWSSQCNKFSSITLLCRSYMSVKHSRQNFQNK